MTPAPANSPGPTGGPTLACLIPAYNAAEFLPRLLTSVANQERPFDEVLVYDDASTDATAAVAEAHGARVIRGEANVGCSAGKNVLLGETRCDWVHFHDADDDLLPHFAKLAAGRAGRADAADVTLFAYEYRRLEDDSLLAVRKFDRAALARDPADYAVRTQINPFCGLYRRDAVRAAGGYDEDPAVLYNEDCAFHIRLALRGLSFAAEDRVSVVNLERPGSMSASNRGKCAAARFAVLRKAAEEGPEQLCDAIGQELWIVARSLAAHKLWPELRVCVRLARGLGVRVPPAEPPLVRRAAAVAPYATFRTRAAYVAARDGAGYG